MAPVREKLAERAQPFLEPGEQVQYAIPAQTGPHPMSILLGYVMAFFMKYRIIVATDRAIVVLKGGALRPTFPKELLARVPRATTIGTKLSGLWGRGELNGENLYIHKRFQADVAAMDAAAGAGAIAEPLPPPPPPPPA